MNVSIFTKFASRAAFSLPEITVVVAIVGIMGSIAVATYGGMSESAKLGVSKDLIEKINGGLKSFSQISHMPNQVKDDNAVTDELAVIRSLQWREAGDSSSGAPYFRADYNPTASSDNETFRLQWNGKIFKLLQPGTDGNGLEVKFDGSDFGTYYEFPEEYTPVGP